MIMDVNAIKQLFVKHKKKIGGFFVAVVLMMLVLYLGWLITLVYPVILFFVFRYIGIKKPMSRVALGVGGIVVGTIIFFGIFSVLWADIPSHSFESSDNMLKATVEPYTTSDYQKNFTISVVYNAPTNATLSYEIKDAFTLVTIKDGKVAGSIKGNTTKYTISVFLDEGVYFMNLSINNTYVIVELIKEKPSGLFQLLFFNQGIMAMGIVSALYVMLTYAIHITKAGAMRVGGYQPPRKESEKESDKNEENQGVQEPKTEESKEDEKQSDG